jgi:hypothetical protein
VVTGDGLAFVARRWFTNRVHRIGFAEMNSSQWKRGLLMNRLVVEAAKGQCEFYVFKDAHVQEAAAPVRAEETAGQQA